MTAEEYERQKEEIDFKACLEKGKLAEQYLRERGVLGADGLASTTTLKPNTSFAEMSDEELYKFSHMLGEYQRNVDSVIRYKRMGIA